jgi:hypothetical protein
MSKVDLHLKFLSLEMKESSNDDEIPDQMGVQIDHLRLPVNHMGGNSREALREDVSLQRCEFRQHATVYFVDLSVKQWNIPTLINGVAKAFDSPHNYAM